MTADFSRYRDIEIRREGAVLWLILARPDVLNAVNERLHAELATVFRDAEADPDSSVIVLTGAGRAFSAGGDVAWMKQLATESHRQARLLDEAREIVFSILDLSKPIIARINGPAIGLGATIALLCDISIASDEASIADPHVRMGLVAGDGGALIWPLLVGYARARDFLLTGRAVSAAEGERIGLVSRLVPAAELDAIVRSVAERLAAGARLAIGHTRQLVNKPLREQARSIMDAGLAAEALTMRSADHLEAVRAFAEGRKPRFSGN